MPSGELSAHESGGPLIRQASHACMHACRRNVKYVATASPPRDRHAWWRMWAGHSSWPQSLSAQTPRTALAARTRPACLLMHTGASWAAVTYSLGTQQALPDTPVDCKLCAAQCVQPLCAQRLLSASQRSGTRGGRTTLQVLWDGAFSRTPCGNSTVPEAYSCCSLLRCGVQPCHDREGRRLHSSCQGHARRSSCAA